MEAVDVWINSRVQTILRDHAKWSKTQSIVNILNKVEIEMCRLHLIHRNLCESLWLSKSIRSAKNHKVLNPLFWLLKRKVVKFKDHRSQKLLSLHWCSPIWFQSENVQWRICEKFVSLSFSSFRGSPLLSYF